MNATVGRRGFIKTAGYAGAAALVSGSAPHAAEERKKITLAFVGVAHIHTPGFIDLLKKRPDVTVKYVWDHDAARAERRAKDLGAKVADLAAIWSDPEVQGVVITSETNRHGELIAAAARAKKHMFAEKPLGITAAESAAMADAIEKAGVLFTTGYFMRTDPKHLFLREQIAKGVFGKITRVRGSNCHSGSLGRWFDTEWRWMADPKIAGVGAFGDLGTHKLDILMWLIGDVASATADIKVVLGNYGDCDESGEAIMKFKNGVTGTLAAGWVDVADPVGLLISGTEAHAVVFGNDLYFKCEKVEGADGNKPWTKLPKGLPAPMHQFVDAIAGKSAETLVKPREAAARVAVMEAMYKGAQEKKWVNVM